MPDIRSDFLNSSDAFLARKAVAECQRQTAIEAATRGYAQAAEAERALWQHTVAAANDRLTAAEQPLPFIPDGYEPGTDKAVDAVLAELAAARAVVDSLPAVPDGKAFRDQLDAAVTAADQAFNSAAANAFNP